MRILMTSTSFYETPGAHQKILQQKFAQVDFLPGPLSAEQLIPIINKYDGIICGDDDYSREVLYLAQGKLKIISKYGVGLDKIDLAAAQEFKIEVRNCVGVNHMTVAEHAFALLLSYFKNIPYLLSFTQKGQWNRKTGRELNGKTIGIVGLGKIGKEMAKRACAFGLNVVAFDTFYDEAFITQYGIKKTKKIEELLNCSDIISLHTDLNANTRGLISLNRIQKELKKGVVIINTARAHLIDLSGLLWGLDHGVIDAYLTDVLDQEPMPENHPLLNYNNVFITPHVGSRTFESVERQGLMAVQNLFSFFTDANKD